MPLSRDYVSQMVLQRFPCGCAIEQLADNSHSITYCSKHKAAPEMYEALSDIKTRFAFAVDKPTIQDEQCYDRAAKALAKAEGK